MVDLFYKFYDILILICSLSFIPSIVIAVNAKAKEKEISKSLKVLMQIFYTIAVSFIIQSIYIGINYVEVPDVVGMDLNNAYQTLGEKDIIIFSDTINEESNYDNKLVVVNQSIPAKQVIKRETQIYLERI